MMAFAARIKELEEEATDLRSRVDARYTASVLLGLGGGANSSSEGTTAEVKNANMVCGRPPITMMGPDGVFAQALADNQLNDTAKRVRRRGKYTPQEREIIRRERNRIHAKKTRDKKRVFLEASETMIRKLEDDVYALRDYLVKCDSLSTEELQEMLNRDRRAQVELASVKDPLRSGSDALVNLSSWDVDADGDEDIMDASRISKRAQAGNSMMQTLFREADSQEPGSTDDEGEDDEDMPQEEVSIPHLRSGQRAGTGQPALSSSSSSSNISDLTSTATTNSSVSDGQGITGSMVSVAASTSSPTIVTPSSNGTSAAQSGVWSSTWSVDVETVDNSANVLQAASPRD